MVTIKPERLLEDLTCLRHIGSFGSGVIRPALSPEDMGARRWLSEKMRAAGLVPTIDAVGNVIGQSQNPGRALLLASHTDTQPQGGWLDGALGVLYGLEVARACAENPETAGYAIDVASWSDEEGTYLGMLGSSSFCGTLDPGNKDRAANHLTGVRLADAIIDAGLASRSASRMDRNRYLAYIEAHIEQGPHLERQSLLLGVVTAIVGVRTFKLNFIGEQNHAGTTPMEYRKDAVNALIEFAHMLTRTFTAMAKKRTVWTIGDIRVKPGSPSVVPGEAEMLLQFRDTEETLLDEMEAKASDLVEVFNREESVGIAITPVTPHQKSAGMNETLQSCLAEAADAHAPGRWTKMPSGAGHDAQIFAPLLPTGMLFIPSIGGISHNINEDSRESDIILGCQALATAAKTVFSRSVQF